MRPRPAARIILLNPENRLLLFRFQFTPPGGSQHTYWASVGGGVEQGETVHQAALRELFEETGIRANDLGPPIGHDRLPLLLETGEEVLAVETFFGHRTAHSDIQTDHWTNVEQDVMVEHRWWSAPEIAATADRIVPQNLTALMARVPKA